MSRTGSITYTLAGTTAATSLVTYQYNLDFKGALSSVTAGNNSTPYTHDGFGRVATSTQTTAGVAYPAFQYTLYSLTDDPTQVTYPTGRVMNYTLDAAGRVGAVKGTMAGVITQYANGVTYNAASAPSTIPFNNGVTDAFVERPVAAHGSVRGQCVGQSAVAEVLPLGWRTDAMRFE